MSHKGPYINRRVYRHKKKSSDENESATQPTVTSGKVNHLNMCDPERCLDNPYFGWKVFFYEEEYNEDSNIVRHVQALENFIKAQEEISSSLTLDRLESGQPFNINVQDLYDDEILLNDWPDFRYDLQENPVHTINCLKLAIHQTVLNSLPEESLKSLTNNIYNLPAVRIRIINYSNTVCLQDLKVNYYGKLISTRGRVIRVCRRKHIAQWVVFSCVGCRLEKIVKQPQGIYTLPTKCDVCGASKFNSILDSPYATSALFQMIRIQEQINDDPENKGRVPRVLDIELVDDLVDSCMPGDDVTAVGIIRVEGVDNTAGKTNVINSVSLFMDCVTLNNNKHSCRDKYALESEMNINDYLAINEVYNDPDIFASLVHSLCPGIYGYEMIKAGLILSLFGGNEKHASLREDIHTLILGDPGLGKSQMLQACARVAAKGVYICGNSSSSSGLTVTLTKENGSSDFALEPGALVLADGGCCCVDEFDKMSMQHQALLEAMEQQSVTVAKSGILCSLPARTSILAAANPIGGRYDRSRTIGQNVNISQPLLSRFDLVFLLLDNPNKKFDSLLCKHVMRYHGSSSKKNLVRTTAGENSSENSEERSLRERLTRPPWKKLDVIPHSILRKYISYARRYVKPRLSDKAGEVLQQYYLELRSRKKIFASVPVYHRQLEAMIRLTEARAKSELRVEATEADAMEVVEILRYTMMNFDNTDHAESISESSDSGKLTNKKLNAFIELLKKEANGDKRKIFSTSELNEMATSGGVVVQDFAGFLSKLNEQGILLRTGRNAYRFVAE